MDPTPVLTTGEPRFVPLPVRKPVGEQVEVRNGRVVRPDARPDEEAQLRKAAQDFEAVFMGLVLKQMRETVHREEFLDGGIGEEFFTELLDEEIAKRMSGRSQTGIAQMLYRQLKGNLHAADPANVRAAAPARLAGISAAPQGGAPAQDGLPPLTQAGGSIQMQLLKAQSGLRSATLPGSLPGP